MDLYADFQGWRPTGDDRHRFLCRGKERDTYEDSGTLTGFTFGRRKSGTMTARIYDKTRDVERKGTDFWPDVWGSSFDRSQAVFRIEFEFARTALRQYGLNTLDEVLAAVPALWLSVTRDWLTYRSPTADETRSRWPVATEWRAVQRAKVGDGAFGIERMYDGRTEGSLRRLMRMLNGLTAHYGALMGTDDIEAACWLLIGSLRDAEIVTRRSFADRVAEYRAKENARGAT
jgi:hypothetical protein